MTDTSPTPAPASTGCCGSKCGWRGYAKVGALVLVSALAGAAITKAVQHRHFGHHGPGHMMGGKMDPAEAEKRITRMTDHLAREVKATDEQKAKLTEIAKAAVKDLGPMRETMRNGHKQAIDLLAGATLDRAAVEKFRTDHLTQMDQLSKRMSTALADAAEVLTPEQRKQLAERLAARHEGRGSHGGWFGSRN